MRRYLRGGPAAEVQRRPGSWTLDEAARALAAELLDGPAQGNAVVVRRLLVERGIAVPLRTLQRALMPQRQARRAAEVATVRFETAPGHQMQIDFGEKLVAVGSALVRVHLFVAVLGYSRRLFTRASLSQRQDDWREGLGRRVPPLRRRAAVATARQCRRAGGGSRSRSRHGAAASGVRRLLPRLGRRGAGVPAVPRSHQGQDRVRRRVRQAQCARRPRIRQLRGARGASRRAGWSKRTSEFTAPPTSGRAIDSSATSGTRCVHCRRIRCRSDSDASRGGWPVRQPTEPAPAD